MRILLLTSFLCILSGCATIVKDDSQPVAFSSEPQDAIIRLNNMPIGKTPSTIMVKRKMGETMIEISKDGYKTEAFPLDKSVASMTFGNIIFGGLIGIGVDAATGKNTNYVDSVHVNLIPLNNKNHQQTKVIQNSPSLTENQNGELEFKRELMRQYKNKEISKEEYLELIKTIN
jgi:hypothetical protein